MSEDLRCKENDRKSKIEGHRRVSDGQTHQRYDARRGAATQQEVIVEECRDEGEGEGEDEEDEEEDEDEDKPMHSSGLEAKAKGKQPVK